MNKAELIKKIMLKKEFSKLPKKDVERALARFEGEGFVDEERVKKTRDLLRKVFSGFVSGKLLNQKIVDKKQADEVLKKHLSTRERFEFYPIIYNKVLKGLDEGDLNVIDLGAGINGLSYNYFPKKIQYIGIEAVGQLVDLTNYYFKTRGIENAFIVQESLFELEKIKKILKQVKGKKIVFLFKVVDSLEMMQRDYSKEFISGIAPLVDRIVVSFATRSFIKRQKFNVNRKWFVDFVKNNFNLIDDFEVGGERYFVFGK